MLQKVLNSAREHIFLTCVQHGLGGFGVAVLLQNYLQGEAFAPLWLGWIFVAFSVIMNAYDVIHGLSAGMDITPRTTGMDRTTRPVFSP